MKQKLDIPYHYNTIMLVLNPRLDIIVNLIVCALGVYLDS